MRVLLLAYDNGMYINMFPLGLAYVASALRDAGHVVEVYHQDIYHYPESHLAEYLNENKFDVVGVGMCGGYYQYAKLKKILEVIPCNVKVMLGGHLVSAEPFHFLDDMGVDKVVGGEAEIIMKHLDFLFEPMHPRYTAGVAWPNLDELAYPAWDLFPIDYYSLIRLPHAINDDRCFHVLSGRGCPFHCTFCYRMHSGYRLRSPEKVVEEIKLLKETYHITYIDFMDELFMISPQRVEDMCEALKPLNIKWRCNGRLNIARTDLLKLMKEAGCVFVNYGVESLDDKVLKNMRKDLTAKQIITGTENTLEAGLSPGLNVIWGNIGDTKETLWKSVEFLRKYSERDELRTIRPVTPYPGCELYYKAIEMGKLEGIEDFYNKHKNSDLLTVNFTDLSDDEFHIELSRANGVLIKQYLFHKQTDYSVQRYCLYERKDASFRGFRQT